MNITALQIAKRFIGIHEVPGSKAHPAIAFALRLVGMEEDDEIAWCSAAVFLVAWLLDLPRPAVHSASARSWLTVGESVSWQLAEPGFDVVVLSRGNNPAEGHVGWFVDFSGDLKKVQIRGGNQNNQWSDAWFDSDRILDIRRLA